MLETQHSITDWADETFGPCTAARAVARMIEEVDELVALDHDAWSTATYTAQLRDECADVVITMYRAMSVLGVDLQRAIDAKMSLNRERAWVIRGDGTGSHVKR